MPRSYYDANVIIEWGLVTENRVYVDSRRNLTVAYFQWLAGVAEPRGHISLKKSISSVGYGFLFDKKAHDSYRWRYSILDFLSFVAGELKPTHVVLNNGLWPSARSLSASFFRRLSGFASRNPEIHWFWKTTTPPRDPDKSRSEVRNSQAYYIREHLQKHGWEILEAERVINQLQKNRSALLYVDNLHFVAEVYRSLNVELVSAISSRYR
eukprot:7924212-Pyramimonas_sp.AAC.1